MMGCPGVPNPYFMENDGPVYQFETTQFFDYPYLVEINLSNARVTKKLYFLPSKCHLVGWIFACYSF